MQKKTKNILEILNKNLVKKEDAVRLSLLAVLSGENIFFYGKSGTVKNITCNRIAKVFKEKPECFTYCLSNGTESLELKENKVALSNSSIVFLDGIWNAESRTLNEILHFLESEKNILFACDTVLPPSKDFYPLWDYFTLKIPVDDTGDFNSFLEMAQAKKNYQITIPEGLLYTSKNVNTIRIKSQNIKPSVSVENAVFFIRKKLFENHITFSDQKWQSIFNLLRTCAFLNNRNEINLMDLQIVEYCIWDENLPFEKAKEIVEASVKTFCKEYPIDKNLHSNIQNMISDFLTIKPQAMDKALFVTQHGDNSYYSFISNSDNKTYYLKRNPSGYYDSDYFEIWDHNFKKSFQVYINLFDIKNGIILWTPAKSFIEHSGKLNMKENFTTFNSEIENLYKTINSKIIDAKTEYQKLMNEEAEKYSDNLFADENFVDILISKASDQVSKFHQFKIALDKIKESYER